MSDTDLGNMRCELENCSKKCYQLNFHTNANLNHIILKGIKCVVKTSNGKVNVDF
jgi:hypothetical protein